MFTVQGLGRTKHTVSHTRCKSVRSTCDLTQNKDKWEGELQIIQATMKEHLESRLKRMTRVCLPDALGMVFCWERAIEGNNYVWRLNGHMSFCPVLGPMNVKKWFAHRSERMWWGVWQNELREVEWQVFMGRAINNRKWLLGNTVMHRQPAQLSESRADVIMIYSIAHSHFFHGRGLGGNEIEAAKKAEIRQNSWLQGKHV